MKINDVIAWTGRILGHDEACFLRIAVLFSLGFMFSIRFGKGDGYWSLFLFGGRGRMKTGLKPSHSCLSLSKNRMDARRRWTPDTGLFFVWASCPITITACPDV